MVGSELFVRGLGEVGAGRVFLERTLGGGNGSSTGRKGILHERLGLLQHRIVALSSAQKSF